MRFKRIRFQYEISISLQAVTPGERHLIVAVMSGLQSLDAILLPHVTQIQGLARSLNIIHRIQAGWPPTSYPRAMRSLFSWHSIHRGGYGSLCPWITLLVCLIQAIKHFSSGLSQQGMLDHGEWQSIIMERSGSQNILPTKSVALIPPLRSLWRSQLPLLTANHTVL